MNNKVFAGLLAAALLLVGGWYYWAQSGSEAVPPAAAIRYPLPPASMTSPAPGDASILQSLRDWLVRVYGAFKFADPDLAARSAGQKIMLRLGTQNSAVVKAKLRELRQELTRGGAG